MKRRVHYGVKKRASHLKNIEVWRAKSGRSRFLSREQYWTLADPESVEFHSIQDSGLLRHPDQYHGINKDPDRVLELRAKHDMIDEKNFYVGDWCLVVDNERPCPFGGLIYIDSTSQPDQTRAKASAMLVAAMRSCGPRTLICLNVCGGSPYKGGKSLSFDAFWANVHDQLPPSIGKLWRRVIDSNQDTDYLPPKTNSTQMCCLFFWRAK